MFHQTPTAALSPQTRTRIRDIRQSLQDYSPDYAQRYYYSPRNAAGDKMGNAYAHEEFVRELQELLEQINEAGPQVLPNNPPLKRQFQEAFLALHRKFLELDLRRTKVNNPEMNLEEERRRNIDGILDSVENFQNYVTDEHFSTNRHLRKYPFLFAKESETKETPVELRGRNMHAFLSTLKSVFNLLFIQVDPNLEAEELSEAVQPTSRRLFG